MNVCTLETEFSFLFFMLAGGDPYHVELGCSVQSSLGDLRANQAALHRQKNTTSAH
jgi:hypothetical protein